MNRTLVSRALSALRDGQRREAFTPANVCFDKQLAVINSPARRKVLLCGRRAGKTTTISFKLFIAALDGAPGVPVLYVTLTRENAKEIIWEDLLRLNEEYALGGKVNVSRLTITLPNKSAIQLRGAHTEREISKYRGKKFKLAVLDEAQSFPDRIIEPLLKEVISPTLMDYQGELWISGTRPPIRAGYFYRCYAGNLAANREQHRWTVVDNTRLPARKAGVPIEAILADIREENAWSEADPTYLREILNEDVEDLESLLFPFRDVNRMATPDGPWTTVFGVDVGYTDGDAIAVLGWQPNVRRVHLLAEHVKSQEDVTDLAEAIKRLAAIWKPIRMVIDEGGGGKKDAAELRRRHSIPVTAAAKTQKSNFIRLLQADMRRGLLVAPEGTQWEEECKLVQRDPKAWMHGELQEKPKGQGGFHSDICMAVLYSWREALHFLEKDPPAPPKDEIEARRMRIAAEMKQREQDAARRKWSGGMPRR